MISCEWLAKVKYMGCEAMSVSRGWARRTGRFEERGKRFVSCSNLLTEPMYPPSFSCRRDRQRHDQILVAEKGTSFSLAPATLALTCARSGFVSVRGHGCGGAVLLVNAKALVVGAGASAWCAPEHPSTRAVMARTYAGNLVRAMRELRRCDLRHGSFSEESNVSEWRTRTDCPIARRQASA